VLGFGADGVEVWYTFAVHNNTRSEALRSKNTQPDREKRNRRLSWLINILGLLALALMLYWGGVEAWDQILASDLRYLLAALAVTVLWNLAAAYRWSRLAKQLASEVHDLPFRYFFTFHMIGMLTGQVLPITIGMLGGRPAALSLSRPISLKRAALSVFVDKFFDLMLALLFVLPVAAHLVGWIDLGAALAWMAGMVVLGLVLLAWRFRKGLGWVAQIASQLSRPLARVPVLGSRLARGLPEQFQRLSTEALVPNGMAAQSLGLTVFLYTLMTARLFFFAEALHLEIPFYLLFMGACIAQLAVVFAVTPGSLGFLEGGWGAVFGLAGLSMAQFTTFALGRRAFMLIFSLLITLLAFAWIRESPAHLFRAVLGASRRAPQDGAPDG
jgi:uncharacterized protein (TIRG00374 family)